MESFRAFAREAVGEKKLHILDLAMTLHGNQDGKAQKCLLYFIRSWKIVLNKTHILLDKLTVTGSFAVPFSAFERRGVEWAGRLV